MGLKKTDTQFVNRYDINDRPKRADEGKMEIRVYNADEQAAVKQYVDRNRAEILAEIDRREAEAK